MKFLYSYKDRANVVHDGVLYARDRDDVYRRLKVEGIRPFHVVVAPGVLNWLLGKGKRWAVIIILGVSVMLLAVNLHASRRRLLVSTAPIPRHQIYGDPALIDEWYASGYASVFQDVGDCFLACFAVPGRLGAFCDIVSEDGRLNISSETIKAIEGCRSRNVALCDDDPRELRELKLIVAGMKDELNLYLSDGVGTVETYVIRLVQRQKTENDYFESAKRMLENESNLEVWHSVNERLRAMGLRTISYAEQDENL